MEQPAWAILAAHSALTLAAAKSHGRQIRLERERYGYLKADFGARNPAFVEALWRRDRILFWSVFAGAMAMALAFIGMKAGSGFGSGTSPPPAFMLDMPPWESYLLLAAVWPFILAFMVSGLASLARLALASPMGNTSGTPSARVSRDPWPASLAWWSLTFALTALIGAAVAGILP
ncbi:MAG: hypothetical protein JWP91_2826 [Fibrobacteres bacterium]|nr:hypothetical protein [Fibrobacterota bacterium]